MEFLSPGGFTFMWEVRPWSDFFFPSNFFSSFCVIVKHVIARFSYCGLGCFFTHLPFPGVGLFLPPLHPWLVRFLSTWARVTGEEGTSVEKCLRHICQETNPWPFSWLLIGVGGTSHLWAGSQQAVTSVFSVGPCLQSLPEPLPWLSLMMNSNL